MIKLRRPWLHYLLRPNIYTFNINYSFSVSYWMSVCCKESICCFITHWSMMIAIEIENMFCYYKLWYSITIKTFNFLKVSACVDLCCCLAFFSPMSRRFTKYRTCACLVKIFKQNYVLHSDGSQSTYAELQPVSKSPILASPQTSWPDMPWFLVNCLQLT